MVIRQYAPSVLETAGPFDSMCIVISQDTLSIRLMKRQRVTYPVRDLFCDIHPSCLNLYPIPAALVENGTVQF